VNHNVAIFVTVVVFANIGAAVLLLWWMAASKSPKGSQETTHTWDDDLTEYNNPMPRWWVWLFALTIVFALGYLALFPGLGNYRGMLNWTEVSQWSGDQKVAEENFDQRFAPLKGQSLAELANNPGAMSTARNLFALNCSACHGSDARGAKGFPNLTDNDWLWGGSPDSIYQTISMGRDGNMPAWGPVLGKQGVEQVMAYVLTLSGREASPELASAGKPTFETICSACHGVDGKGNQAIGAPNLTDKIWLHGGTPADIRESITNGRVNHMPAQLERLGETKVRLLAAYVYGLSAPAQAGPAATAASEQSHAGP
jgi:cytochrome c oxidase cbb3-type subunit III